MLLDRFFKPKWLHRNPDIRKKALQELSHRHQDAANIFAQVAENDQEPDVRRIAIKRMTDLSVLARLLSSESEPQVLEIAHNRFAQLMVEQEKVDKLVLVDLLKDDSYEFVLKNAQDCELRKAVLSLTRREGLLGDVAIHDSDQQVRRIALDKISRKSTLERVYKQTRSKDKVLSNEAKRRLDEISFKEKRPIELKKQARHLCSSLEKLDQTGDWDWALRRFEEIDENWSDIKSQWQQDFGQWDEELEERFQKSRRHYKEAESAYLEREQERRAEEARIDPIKAEKKLIIEELSKAAKLINTDAEPDHQTLSEFEQLLLDSDTKWRSLEKLEDQEKELIAEFKKQQSSIDRFVKDMQCYFTAQQVLEKCTKQLEDLLNHEHVQEKKFYHIKRAWENIERPKYFSLDANMLNTIAKQIADIEDKISKVKEKSAEQIKTFSDKVKELERYLSGGKIAEAKKMVSKLNNVLTSVHKSDLQKLEKSGALRDFREHSNKIEELHKWRAWANTPVKERLVNEAEELAQKLENSIDQFDLNEVAQIINDKRQQWRSLGASESKNAQELWDRFNVACNNAYAYCKEFFESQSEQRKINKEKKESICNQLEEFSSKADWATINWGKVEKIISTAKQEWSNAGIVDRKYNKVLNDRFTEVLKILKSHLSDVREKNRVRKEQLINKMQDITQELMVSKEQDKIIKEIVTQVKSLQQDWQKIGKAAKEHELWKRFRGCCDSVFDIRDELNSERNKEKENNLEEKLKICEEMESIVNMDLEQFSENRSRIEPLKSQWKQVGQIPAEQLNEINKRYDGIVKDYSNKLQKFYVAEETKLIENLKTIANERDKIWDQLSNMDHDLIGQNISALKSTIDSRLSNEKALCQHLNVQLDDMIGLMQDNQQQLNERIMQAEKECLGKKLELCLKMEIYANLDTPEEFKQDRMKYQVSQLENHLKGDSDVMQDNDQARAEIIEWFLVGPTNSEQRAVLEQRFQNICQHVLGN